ncbi:hypothetical protein FBU30_000475 [Linnemannia zychae]|nr:hypothetical protein FBU30_000475 [Linnemannia zychae]
MPKSLRGNFNYIDLNMYRPFNFSNASSQSQFSDPAFSPTVHIPSSLLFSNSLNSHEDSYQSTYDETSNYVTDQVFEYPSQPYPAINAMQQQQQQNFHPQQPQFTQDYQSQNHLQNDLYQNFNQQDLNDANYNNGTDYNSNNNGQQMDERKQTDLAQMVEQPPSSPPVQLINGMHPDRLAMLMTPSEPTLVAKSISKPTPKSHSEKKSRKRKEKALAAMAKQPVASVKQSTVVSPTPSSPSSTLSNPPISPKKALKPAPDFARVDPRNEPLATQLNAAILAKSTKRLGNIIRRAAGECIIRAFLHIMSRNFAYISYDLFLALYAEAFECPNLTDELKHDSMLNGKPFKSIIEVKCGGSPPLKYYRLNPRYFLELGNRVNEEVQYLKQEPDSHEIYYDLTNRDELPAITPLPPSVVRQLLNNWELKLLNITAHYYAFIPASWSAVASLNDLLPFISYWYMPQNQFSEYISPLNKSTSKTTPADISSTKVISNKAILAETASAEPKIMSTIAENASMSPVPRPLAVSDSINPPTVDRVSLVYELLLEAAKQPGRPGREGRRLLRMHEQQLVNVNLDVPPQITAILGDKGLSDDSDMELDDDNDDDAPSVIDLTPTPVPMTVSPSTNNTHSATSDSNPLLAIETQSNGAILQDHNPADLNTMEQHKDRISDGISGPVRFSMKNTRYLPYADKHTSRNVFDSDSGRKSKSLGEDGPLAKVRSDLSRSDRSSNKSLPTLPRPALPPLDGQEAPSTDSIAFAMLARNVDSDLTTPLLRRSRDDILKQRREAMNKIIEYTMRLPMRKGPKD